MTFSPEERAALLARAGELRTEVSSLTADRDAALRDHEQVLADQKLIAEVARLETEVATVQAQRDTAVSNNEAAADAMAAAIEVQAALEEAKDDEPVQAVIVDEPVVSEPVVNDKAAVEPVVEAEAVPATDPTIETEGPVTDVAETAPASPAQVASKKTGGSR